MSDSLLLRIPSIVEPLPLRTLFPVVQEMHVELGAGDGSFLVAYAKAHPEINFLGVERLLGRIRKIDRKSRRAGLQNLRLARIEADYFIRFLLPAGSAQAIHIYFPDPWPKRRHWKNRLIHPDFVSILAKALSLGGVVYLRTDDRPYFEQMLASFLGSASFEKLDTLQELLGFVTDFERGFHARGVSTLHASYRKIG